MDTERTTNMNKLEKRQKEKHVRTTNYSYLGEDEKLVVLAKTRLFSAPNFQDKHENEMAKSDLQCFATKLGIIVMCKGIVIHKF